MYYVVDVCGSYFCFFFFQAEDGIRDLVRSRGLGDVYKRQAEEEEEDSGQAGFQGPGADVQVEGQSGWRSPSRLSLIHI